MVDASVSKTDEVTLVPVRSRPRVQGGSRWFGFQIVGIFLLFFIISKKIFLFGEILKLFCYFCKLFSETKFIMKKILLGLLLIVLFIIGLFS